MEGMSARPPAPGRRRVLDQETSMKIVRLATAALGALLAPALAAAAGPNDAQIAAIVVTANQVDIDAGQYAEGHAASAQVKDFAKRMVTDHSAVNKSATELAGRLHLTPEDNPTAQSLKKGGDDNVANLKTLSGAAFDKAYVDHEVAYHEAVLGALDSTLIPSASNADLKALMVKVRPAFVAHLDHAKMLQAQLAK
jgi:putative membrane protein